MINDEKKKYHPCQNVIFTDGQWVLFLEEVYPIDFCPHCGVRLL